MGAFLLHDFRCEVCGKLLFRGNLLFGAVEVKCKRCGRVLHHQVFNAQLEENGGYIIIINHAGIIVGANNQVNHFLGYQSKELLGLPIRIISPSLQINDINLMFDSPKANRNLSIKSYHQNKDGNKLNILIEACLIKDNETRFIVLTCKAVKD